MVTTKQKCSLETQNRENKRKHHRKLPKMPIRNTRKNNDGQTEQSKQRMAAVCPHIVTTLNVKGLNSQIKRHSSRMD